MSDLRIELVTGDDAVLIEDWQHVHNTIIPTAPLSADEIRERAGRNRLEVAYRGDVLVGCSTVRPATEEDPVTVIARVLPDHRRQGIGTQIYTHCLAYARTLGDGVVDTVVLASNAEGLHFAERHGFAEIERYLLDGDTIPFVTLRLG